MKIKLIICSLYLMMSTISYADFIKSLGIKINEFDKTSVPLYEDQVLIFTGEEKIYALYLSDFKEKSCKYHLKIVDRETRKKTVHTGLFRENHKRAKTENGYFLEDIDSDLTLSTGDFNIKWSYGSIFKGHIYFESRKGSFIILNKKFFNKL